MIVAVTLLVLVLGPACFAIAGLARAGPGREPAATWNWRQTVSSALLCTLAFNLTFLAQEVFLVLPKALTPGLRPTLFHNNHTWEGENPLASLWQGAGALAIFISGAVCALLARRPAERSSAAQLLLIWMAYNGLFQSLPQVVIGAVSPQSDVGMAMAYLRLGAPGRSAAALAALALVPLGAGWLTRCFLSTAADPAQLASPRARTRFMFQIATLPALIAIALIIPFRVPREFIEVVLLPVVVMLLGTAWLQALAWRVPAIRTHADPAAPIAYPLMGVIALLLVFQLVLKRGIAFY